MDTTTLMLSILFGSIGMGLFVFGKKQGLPLHLVAGLALMVLPYIIPNPLAMTGVAVLLAAGPFYAPH
jgi:hypothetical protein